MYKMDFLGQIDRISPDFNWKLGKKFKLEYPFSTRK